MKHTLPTLATGVLLLTLVACKDAPPPVVENRIPTLQTNQVSQWEAAATKGTPKQQYDLAKMFRDGEGMPKDPARAAQWFLRAAESHHPKSQHQLGELHREGAGVAKDDKEAAKWFERAAKQGYEKSQEQLGMMYWKGEGVATNHVEAHKWLTLSAGQGDKGSAKWAKRLEALMSKQQLEEARKLEAAFVPEKKYKKDDEKE